MKFPQTNEAATYYFPYINLAQTDDIVSFLKDQQAEMKSIRCIGTSLGSGPFASFGITSPTVNESFSAGRSGLRVGFRTRCRVSTRRSPSRALMPTTRRGQTTWRNSRQCAKRRFHSSATCRRRRGPEPASRAITLLQSTLSRTSSLATPPTT